MPMTEPSLRPGEPREVPAAQPRRRWRGLLLRLCLLLAFALALGFLLFAASLPRAEVRSVAAADGIVVLTGGASRIVDAVELLSADRGKRLLISGVNPTTTHAELVRMNPEVERLLIGRIDLGREATNTIGNAVETGQWARKENFRSLIVVTSGWHMPRALIEIAHELPDVKLIPYPVVSDRMREEPWWSDLHTIRLLLVEYAKYLASFIRIRLAPTHAAVGERRRQL
jgi:uncharacterized SAM-binding protein YcdF (DUF218 family)